MTEFHILWVKTLRLRRRQCEVTSTACFSTKGWLGGSCSMVRDITPMKILNCQMCGAFYVCCAVKPASRLSAQPLAYDLRYVLETKVLQSFYMYFYSANSNW